MTWIITFLSILLALLIIDSGWLLLVASKLYRAELGDNVREKPKLGPAAVFYLVYAAGVTLYGVVPTSLHDASYGIAALWGAGLGLFAYATYGLTSWSVFKGWSAKLAVPDILWGGVLTGLVTMIGLFVYRLVS